ncbi:histidine kinase [Chryseobacterium sp. 09-1422]|uniref:Histidine kinase n=1 Tax=Chryseobacterium kimseyorum TaxID=2984028 RepID=A0ABT3I3M4_9FLAO|nr:histidine kinase [Chryseobacterium kimseyorum]MCW3170669.1 histidine kinase [Chryseobacterium kimseyorum]
MNWQLAQPSNSVTDAQKTFLLFDYFFFASIIYLLLEYNLKKIKYRNLRHRAKCNLVIVVFAYGFLVLIMYYWTGMIRTAAGILVLQYFIVYLLSTFLGHALMMFNDQLEKEGQIEQLKTENLQSRYDALRNQINPHFFFNSLNGISSLIRKGNDDDTLSFVTKMSDVFRYILQSEKKCVVNLQDEIEFIGAFKYMLETRFANKLEFNIEIEELHKNYKIPVLTMLPLIDNIVVHNVIDSLNKMVVNIYINNKSELTISNPIQPKLIEPVTNGTGLENLENRYTLLMLKKIRIENDGKTFSVMLPLI